ncbi:hypothetical protein F5876DRAFT_3931, partial [Lentinula aff. lateritia]
AHNVGITKTALHKIIQDTGITYKRLRRAAAERGDERRAEWKAEINAHYVASQIIVVDETSKDDRTIYRHYGRAPSG